MINFRNEEMLRSNYYPIFEKERLEYARYEKSGYLSLKVERAPTVVYKMLNPSAVYMCGQMNGKNSVNCILDLLTKEYGDVDRKTVEKDLCQLLVEGWMLGFIKWEGETPMNEFATKEIGNGFKVKVAFDEDTKTLFDFFSEKRHIKFYKSPKFAMGNKTPLLLRYNLFTMNFLYYLFYENNDVVGVMIVDISSIDSTATIDYIEMSKSLPEDILHGMIFTVIDNLNTYSLKNCNKVKVYLENNEHNKETFNNIGFQDVALLVKEYKDKDVLLLEYPIGGNAV